MMLMLALTLTAAAQDTGPDDPPFYDDTGNYDTGYDTGDIGPCHYECTMEGACEEVAGVCTPTSTEHCEQSEACYQYGDCALVGEVCAPALDEHCLDSGICSYDGACSLVEGLCVISSDEDCAQSEICEEDGGCGFVDGGCVPTEEAHCEAAGACEWDGRCGRGDEECVPTLDAHCAESERCLDYGDCALDGEECVATAASCRATAQCLDYGRCDAEDGVCVASSEADCNASTDCLIFGDCHLVDSTCDQTSAADCEAPCLYAGHCEYMPLPEPEPLPEPDPSEVGILGALAGQSTLANLFSMGPHPPTCVARDETDCENSQRCQEEDEGCTYDDMHQQCSDSGLMNSLIGAVGEWDSIMAGSDMALFGAGGGGEGGGGDGYGAIVGLGGGGSISEWGYPGVNYAVESRRGDLADLVKAAASNCETAAPGERYIAKVGFSGRLKIRGPDTAVVFCLTDVLTSTLMDTRRAKYTLTVQP